MGFGGDCMVLGNQFFLGGIILFMIWIKNLLRGKSSKKSQIEFLFLLLIKIECCNNILEYLVYISNSHNIVTKHHVN